MTAEHLLLVAAAYVATGIAVGLSFLLFAMDRLFQAARGAYAFRVLLLPGMAMLWPWVLWRWLALRRAAVRS